VLLGHADEDLGVTYQPWIEVVSSIVRDVDTPLLDTLRPAQRPQPFGARFLTND
jgi:hypothetical protein